MRTGQLVGGEGALPLVAAIAWHGHQAVPIGPDGRAAGGDPADVAGGAGEDQILRRRPPVGHGLGEAGPVVGVHVFDGAEVGGGSGLAPDGADSEGVVGRRVQADDGAVAGEEQVDLAGGGAFHRDGLVDDAHVLPPAAVPVLARVGRVQVVDVEVFLIDGEDREAEGDRVVVAHRNAWRGRLSRADDVEAGRLEMDDVAQRGDAQGAVRVVGQDRAAGGRTGRGDDPVVRALRRGAVGHGSQGAVGGRFGGAHARRREGDVAGGELIVL